LLMLQWPSLSREVGQQMDAYLSYNSYLFNELIFQRLKKKGKEKCFEYQSAEVVIGTNKVVTLGRSGFDSRLYLIFCEVWNGVH
jgi:hypothetical protein